MSKLQMQAAKMRPVDPEWELVERVLASQQFSRTVRLRDFLRFVASRHMEQPGTPIPEQEIGAAVFGRSPDYDTGVDNIVRVSAGDLRRRLEHYFLDEGVHEPMLLEMPRGGYSLAFRSRAPAPEQPEMQPPAGAAVTANVLSVRAAQHPQQGSPNSVNAAWRWIGDIRTLSLLALCACLIGVCWYMLSGSPREPWRQTDALRAVWSPFLGPAAGANVVMADTGLGLVKVIAHAHIDLPDYLSYRYKALETDPRLDASTRGAVINLLARNTGSISDFKGALKILDLTGDPKRLAFGSARDFTPEQVKSTNVILVGSGDTNPWVELYRDRRFFLLGKDAANESEILNLKVGAGEQAVYRVPQGQGLLSGFAVVAVLPNLDPEKRVMIIEGMDSQATLAASSFITSEAGARALRDRLQGRPLPGHYEILLGSQKLLATPLQAHIIAVHADAN